jgi:hypothetical protein
MVTVFDRNSSLQELENDDWGEPTFGSYLVTTVHRLRRKPLKDLTVEDLRLLIGQGIGLRFLVPLAVEQLELDPLVAGDFYPGDLLAAVLRVGDAYWMRHPDIASRLCGAILQLENMLLTLDGLDQKTVATALEQMPAIIRQSRNSFKQ